MSAIPSTTFVKQRSRSVDVRQKGLPPLPLFSRPEDPVIASLPPSSRQASAPRKTSMSSIPVAANKPRVVKHSRSQSAVTVSAAKLGYHLEQHSAQPFDRKQMPIIHNIKAHQPKLVIRTPKQDPKSPKPEELKKTVKATVDPNIKPRLVAPAPPPQPASSSTTLRNKTDQDGSLQKVRKTSTSSAVQPQLASRHSSPKPDSKRNTSPAAPVLAIRKATPRPASNTEGIRKASNASTLSGVVEEEVFEGVGESTELVISRPPSRPQSRGRRPAPILTTEPEMTGNVRLRSFPKGATEVLKAAALTQTVESPSPRTRSFQKVAQWDYMCQQAQKQPASRSRSCDSKSSRGDPFHLEHELFGWEGGYKIQTLETIEDVENISPCTAKDPGVVGIKLEVTQRINIDKRRGGPPASGKPRKEPSLETTLKYRSEQIKRQIITGVVASSHQRSYSCPQDDRVSQRQPQTQPQTQPRPCQLEAWEIEGTRRARLQEPAPKPVLVVAPPIPNEGSHDIYLSVIPDSPESESSSFALTMVAERGVTVGQMHAIPTTPPHSFPTTPDLARSRSPSFRSKSPQTPTSPVSPISPTSRPLRVSIPPISPINSAPSTPTLLTHLRHKLSSRPPNLQAAPTQKAGTPFWPTSETIRRKFSSRPSVPAPTQTAGTLLWPTSHTLHRLKPRKTHDLPKSIPAPPCAVCSRGPLPTMWMCTDCVDSEGRHWECESEGFVLGAVPKKGPWDDDWRGGCHWAVCRGCANEGIAGGVGELV